MDLNIEPPHPIRVRRDAGAELAALPHADPGHIDAGPLRDCPSANRDPNA